VLFLRVRRWPAPRAEGHREPGRHDCGGTNFLSPPVGWRRATRSTAATVTAPRAAQASRSAVVVGCSRRGVRSRWAPKARASATMAATAVPRSEPISMGTVTIAMQAATRRVYAVQARVRRRGRQPAWRSRTSPLRPDHRHEGHGSCGFARPRMAMARWPRHVSGQPTLCRCSATEPPIDAVLCPARPRRPEGRSRT